MGHNSTKFDNTDDNNTKPQHSLPPQCYPIEEWTGKSDSYLCNPKKKENDVWVDHQGQVKEVIKSLSFITYNVWFEEIHAEERNIKILDLIIKYEPDIVCLQEVTRPFIDLLKQRQDITSIYSLSDINGKSVNPYGLCLLSKLPIEHLAFWSLPTQMGRSCLLAEYVINNTNFFCATVHLESLNLSTYRKLQLEIIHDLLKKADVSLLMGDFNIDSDIDYSHLIDLRRQADSENKEPSELWPPTKEPGQIIENHSVDTIFSDYDDIWLLLNKEEKGYTYDSVINKMIPGFERMRYDRVLLSKDKCWKATSIEIIGMNQITEIEDQYIYPSDHFGLYMKLEYTSH